MQYDEARRSATVAKKLAIAAFVWGIVAKKINNINKIK
jgi:hypothetical protein